MFNLRRTKTKKNTTIGRPVARLMSKVCFVSASAQPYVPYVWPRFRLKVPFDATRPRTAAPVAYLLLCASVVLSFLTALTSKTSLLAWVVRALRLREPTTIVQQVVALPAPKVCLDLRLFYYLCGRLRRHHDSIDARHWRLFVCLSVLSVLPLRLLAEASTNQPVAPVNPAGNSKDRCIIVRSCETDARASILARMPISGFN